MKRKKITSVIAVILAILMLASLMLSVIPASAFADELSDLKAQRSSLADKVKECQERLEGLKSKQSNALEQKAALDEQKRLAQEELELIEQEIAGYDRLIAQKEKEVESAKNRESDQLNRYRSRIRSMEESGGFNILSVIASSDSFAGLLTSFDDMAEIMKSDRDLQTKYLMAREETEAIKQEYEEEKAEYEADQADLKVEQTAIENKIQETEEYLAELEEDIEKAIKEYEEAERAEEAAAATIANMIAQLAAQKAREEEAKKAEAQAQLQQMQQANQTAIENGETPPYTDEQVNQVQNTVNNSNVLGGGNVSSTTGLTWPVPCSTRVTSRFGNRADPFTGATKYHSGIDIDGFGNDGNIIVAAAAGTVITSSSDSAYGNYVVIDHGGMQTLYAHNSGNAVSVGTYVEAGQTIGYLGATGRATGTHCHFEVFVGGSRVDPAQYFSGLSYYNC